MNMLILCFIFFFCVSDIHMTIQKKEVIYVMEEASNGMMVEPESRFGYWMG